MRSKPRSFFRNSFKVGRRRSGWLSAKYSIAINFVLRAVRKNASIFHVRMKYKGVLSENEAYYMHTQADREIVNYIEDTQREENSSSFFNHLALLRFLAKASRHLKVSFSRTGESLRVGTLA